jgi:hypothetical protein
VSCGACSNAHSALRRCPTLTHTWIHFVVFMIIGNFKHLHIALSLQL